MDCWPIEGAAVAVGIVEPGWLTDGVVGGTVLPVFTAAEVKVDGVDTTSVDLLDVTTDLVGVAVCEELVGADVFEAPAAGLLFVTAVFPLSLVGTVVVLLLSLEQTVTRTPRHRTKNMIIVHKRLLGGQNGNTNI